MPEFTLGFAIHDRAPAFFETTRLKFTIMSIVVGHPLIKDIVIIDNNPDESNRSLRELPDKTHGLVRYVEMPEPKGTSAPRNRVFEEAKLEHVICLDAHCLLYPGAFESLSNFYDLQGHDCPDVIHGPLMTEQRGAVMATHMNDQWRDEMLGTWGRAWLAPTRGKNDTNFFSTATPDADTLAYVNLPQDLSEQRELTDEEATSMRLPLNIPWGQHEQVLTKAGCRPPSGHFCIPGHGMGLFACRKDSWLPFHPEAQGFGGEEITTGYRFRQAGRRAWCVMGLRWWHDFDRPPQHPIPYDLFAYDKIYNYVREFQRLGLDLTPIREHFPVGRCSEGEWQQIVAGSKWPAPTPDTTHSQITREAAQKMQREKKQVPLEKEVEMKIRQKNKCGTKEAHTAIPTGIMGLYTLAVNSTSPVAPDLRHLKHLASMVKGDVVELAHQSISAIALLAANPRYLTTYGAPINSGRADQLRAVLPQGVTYDAIPALPVQNEQIPENNLLFLDIDPHTGQYYYDLLKRFEPACKRFIAIHDWKAYHKNYNDEEGLGLAVDMFLREHPDWFNVGEIDTPNGLLVLSRNIDDNDNVEAPEEELATIAAAQQAVGSALGQQAPKDQPTPVKPPDHGPGTELKLLLDSLGVVEKPNCDCRAKAAAMNQMGVKGCRENMNTIVGWMKDGAAKWGWLEKVKAAAAATTTGLAFKINPFNMWTSIIEECIRRAEVKEQEGAK